MRPMRIDRPIRVQPEPDDVLPVPEDPGTVAPDWRSPTEDNGAGLARDQLHLALVVPDRATYDLIRGRAYLVTPKTWGGKVFLHTILETRKNKYSEMPTKLLTAMSDLGLMDSRDLGISEVDMDLGYPTGKQE